jgi:hypothetical protein
MISTKEFAELQRIAHELVDAESAPCWDNHEIIQAEKCRKKALEAMRLIGRRQLDKIGKEDDWGT